MVQIIATKEAAHRIVRLSRTNRELVEQVLPALNDLAALPDLDDLRRLLNRRAVDGGPELFEISLGDLCVIGAFGNDAEPDAFIILDIELAAGRGAVGMMDGITVS